LLLARAVSIASDRDDVHSALMPEALRITVVNAAYDPSVSDCDVLLDRYATLTGWCGAMTAAGAELHVVQRFPYAAIRRRDGAEIIFVSDGGPPTPAPGARLRRVVDAVVATGPRLVHVNGLGFPSLIRALRAAVLPRAPIVVQDHAGVRMPAGRGPIGRWRRGRWRSGMSAADAISFSAASQAEPWQAAGIVTDQRVLVLLESSTRIAPAPREEARARTGLSGLPLVLWVGRLIPNKDPLTVLGAFEQLVRRHRHARLGMVFQHGSLVRDVSRAVAASEWLRSSVTLVGPVTPGAIGDYYSAADLFVSGSHSEGSGYALIEAMACGLVPVVTSIPSFVAIAGACGVFWPPGDTNACADALFRGSERHLAKGGAGVRDRFSRELSWPIIAARTLAAYRALVADRARKEDAAR
jgi:glycosyltransferase involved in cell wall biosynthesis